LVAKRAAAVGGAAVGGAAGGFFNNPGAIAAIGIVVAIITSLLVFRKDITDFLGGLRFPEFPEITLPTFPDITFPDFPDINIEFPDITFPEFPTFEFPDFGDFFNGGDGGPGPVPPGPIGDPEITLPEGCFIDSQGRLDCPTPPTFDVCDDFPELCEPCGPNEIRIGGICTPAEPVGGETPLPGPPLPPGFEGGGPSFEGGFIFETNDCFLSLSQLIDKYGVTASQAADIKAQACTAEPGEQPTDFPEDFDFGTSTGAGGTPTTEESGIVTGGATLESEAQRAACTSCDLFGLNCPICRGEIGA